MRVQEFLTSLVEICWSTDIKDLVEGAYSPFWQNTSRQVDPDHCSFFFLSLGKKSRGKIINMN